MAGRLKRLPLAWAVFAAAAVASAALILVVARDTTFSGDEWGILFRLAHDPLSTALFKPPPDKYLIAVPTLMYDAIAASFGASSYLPYRLLGLALTVLAAGLFLALAKRRAPLVLALPCAILLLFLGAAWEVVAIPARVPSQVAICAGLALLLALDRRDRPGDLAACGLGTIAVVSHPVGLAFVLAAAVIVPFGRPRGWTRSWVFLVPLAVYGLWWAILRETRQHFPVTFGDVVSFAWNGFVALCATLTGLFRPPLTGTTDFSTAASRAVAIVLLIGLVAAVVRARRVSVGLIAGATALAFNLITPPLAPGGLALGFRPPDSPRYIYPGTILLLLVIVEVVALRPRVPARARATVGAVVATAFGLALVFNVVQLIDSARDYRETSQVVNAELGALDLARSGRKAASEQEVVGASEFLAYVPNFTMQGRPDLVAGAAPAYYVVRDRYGSTADNTSAILAQPLWIRRQADRALIEALHLQLEPVDAAVARSAWSKSASPRTHGDGCRRVARDEGSAIGPVGDAFRFKWESADRPGRHGATNCDRRQAGR